jgi:hypothetical protein
MGHKLTFSIFGVRNYLRGASGFAISRAWSMKSCATGLSVRFFNRRMPKRDGGIVKLTGSTLSPTAAASVEKIPENLQT